ncbi:MAG: hypothetical protein MI867_02810 [Pseudomonadales bacterium]|nr:hypothetical protein [Pseudomonadales bacterium]
MIHTNFEFSLRFRIPFLPVRAKKWLTQLRVMSLISVLCFFSALSNASEEQGNEDLGVVLGTLMNFIEYYQETLVEIKQNGGSGPVSMPQWSYDPGLGPVNVLPEFSADLGLALTPLYLLDVPSIPFEYRFYINTPEVPAIDRKVVGITEDDGYTDPHIPPLRWSADGRLGVESQVGGSLANPSPVRLYLFAPERLQQPFVESPTGPASLALDEYPIPFSELAQGKTGSIQHTNICDPYIKGEGERRNPYSCGIDGQDDCYDVTLVSAYVRLSNVADGDNIPPKLDKGDRVMGTPLHIRVSNPKTAQAKIEEVTYGESKYSDSRTGVLFETITPADGRLMLARRGFLPLLWENQSNGNIHFGSYDVVYAVSSPDSDPCDVTDWGELYPITHAPYDSRVNNRYAFAMQPFRDPNGNIIPDGVDIKGTYPWMDKEAKNFSIQVSPAKLFPTYAYDQNAQSRYPVRCVSQTDCSVGGMSDTDNSKDNMFVIMGAWTQGKMVLVDGKLNDIDFRLGGLDHLQSYLSLYKPGTGHDANHTGEVRVGSTRGGAPNARVYDDQGSFLGTYSAANLSMLDSIENRLNYLMNLKPSKFQDVVWNMSSGHSTVEFSFDDYLNPDGFIVSNMVAHMDHQNNHWYRMNYYDGWHQMTRSFNGQVRVQNSATALPDRWNIPANGRVYNGRMEPVANGGIRGKGMWFNGGTTRIDYKIEDQPQSVHEQDWFYSLFMDPRFGNDRHERVLIRFPDKSQITIKGLHTLKLYNSRRRTIAEIVLPDTLPEKGWSHLGFHIAAETVDSNTGSISVFVNGFHHQSWSGSFSTTPIEKDNFRPVPGTLRLGKGSLWGGKRAFKGWLDEFKVFAYEPNPEVICNYGHGTIVGLPSDYEGNWKELANNYSSESHQYVMDELASYGERTYDQYICYHDYSDDNQAHAFNIPEGLVSLRESINFPEGPLYFDTPRPDSSHNDFCLSCHHDTGIAGLTIEALRLDGLTLAKDDPRRQPTQPPAKVYGNIPSNWINSMPAQAFVTGSMGLAIDEYVLPSGADVKPEIKNLVLATSDEHPWQAISESNQLEIDSLPNNVTKLRVNVNGLVRQVMFEVNGYIHYDNTVPFTVDLELLEEGDNQIEIVAYDDNGEESVAKMALHLY